MSKRYQPLKEFGRTMKKPKLEISINKGHPTASTSKAAYDAHIRPTQKEPFKSAVDLWDDDEDDVLLLATQVAESEIAASKAKKEESPMEITNSEITFSEFEPKIKQHSTQQAPQNDLFSQMFDDDDDDIASLAAALENDAKRQPTSSRKHFEKEYDETIFKKPTLPQRTYSKSSTSDDEPGPSTKQVTIPISQLKDINIAIEKRADLPQSTYTKLRTSDDVPGPSSKLDSIPMSQTADTSASARKQLASERQIKFLMERLDALKQENTQLNKDLTDVKETMQTKTGEASMLRDELRHTKQKLDELKMEKMFQTETVNAESRNKIEELSKQVQDKESQLQLKSMECSMLKMRQGDETRRFDTTTRDTTIPAICETNEKDLFPINLADFTQTDPPIRVESASIMLTKEVFERNEVKGSLRKWNTLIHQELDNLQRILAQVQLEPDGITSELSKQVTESVCKVFLEFLPYVESLDFGFNQPVLPQHEYNVLEDKSKRLPSCLHSSTAMFNGERAITMRRYIAILAVICERSSKFVRTLLAETHEQKPLLQVAIDAVIKLGFSLEICEHFGVLEAFAVLLRTMLLHLQPDENGENPYLELLFRLLKHLVFTRPSPWILYELSFSVIDMCDRFPYVFSLFCVNSPRDTFLVDRTKSVYRFSNDSCLLQVYCSLLEAAFPLYRCLNQPMFELQTKLCLNHVRFVFYCLTDPPDFIEKILSSDEDDDESDDDSIEIISNPQSNKSKEPYETFRDEKPTTSKNAASRDERPATSKNAATSFTKADSASNTTDNTAKGSTKSDQQCQCFEELCLTAVRMVWLSLRQWQRFERIIDTKRVGTVSHVAVHLFYFLFCDNYCACLFREDEDTTKHFIYLICHWWLEYEKELEFSEIHVGLLKKIKASYVIPKLFYEEEAKPENVAADLAEWCRVTNEPFDPSVIDAERAIKNLNLEEELADPEIFFEISKKPSLDMESFEFK